MKYSLVSQNAMDDCLKKVQLIRREPKGEFSGWLIISMNENESLFLNSPNYFERVNNEHIYNYFDIFKEIENAEVGSIYVHNLGFEKLVKINRDKAVAYDDSTYATNQSGILIDFDEWYIYNQQPNLLIGIIEVLIYALVEKFPSLSNWLGDSNFWLLKIRHKDEDSIKTLFEKGDILPGIVTGTNPITIAAMTNLTKGFGSYPAICIKNYKNWKLNDFSVKVGDKVPVAALYLNNINELKKHWEGFYFYPVLFATDDKNKIHEKIYSISEEEWDSINENLEQIKNINKEGLYKIDNLNSDW